MTRRVFVAGLLHETHGFVDDVTPEAAFTRHHGAATLARLGDASQLDGLLAGAREEGWELIPGPPPPPAPWTTPPSLPSAPR